MSPVVSSRGPEEGSPVDVPKIEGLIEVRLGDKTLWFKPDARLAPQRTISEGLSDTDQVTAAEYLAMRAELVAGLRSSQVALNPQELHAAAQRENLFHRFRHEFGILKKLGIHPFPQEYFGEPKRDWPHYNLDMNPLGTSFTGDLSNISLQPVRTALALCKLAELAPFRLSQASADRLIGDALLMKALKPFEVVDRKLMAEKPSRLPAGSADTPERLNGWASYCVDTRLISQADATRILAIARHTVGQGGYVKFLKWTGPNSIEIQGDPHFQILRAFDDCTTSLDSPGPGEPMRYGFSPPAEKTIVIARKRGDGLFGVEFLYDPASILGTANCRTVGSGELSPGALSMAGAQSLLSECVLIHLVDSLGINLGFSDQADVVPAFVRRLGEIEQFGDRPTPAA